MMNNLNYVNETAVIIQVRAGSVRLPNKMLLDFYKGKTIPEIIVTRIRNEFKQLKIIIATSNNPIDDALENLAQRLSISCFRGSESDVLKRFIDCALFHKINRIIRVCGDNPFLDMMLLRKLLNESVNGDIEYSSYMLNHLPAIKTHLGIFTEWVTLSALERVYNRTNDKFYKEHVTNFIYEHEADFKIKWLSPGPFVEELKDIRLTVDTFDDFKVCQDVFKHLQEPFSIEDVIAEVRKKPEIIQSMISQIKDNQK